MNDRSYGSGDTDQAIRNLCKSHTLTTSLKYFNLDKFKSVVIIGCYPIKSKNNFRANRSCLIVFNLNSLQFLI